MLINCGTQAIRSANIMFVQQEIRDAHTIIRVGYLAYRSNGAGYMESHSFQPTNKLDTDTLKASFLPVADNYWLNPKYILTATPVSTDETDIEFDFNARLRVPQHYKRLINLVNGWPEAKIARPLPQIILH